MGLKLETIRTGEPLPKRPRERRDGSPLASDSPRERHHFKISIHKLA